MYGSQSTDISLSLSQSQSFCHDQSQSQSTVAETPTTFFGFKIPRDIDGESDVDFEADKAKKRKRLDLKSREDDEVVGLGFGKFENDKDKDKEAVNGKADDVRLDLNNGEFVSKDVVRKLEQRWLKYKHECDLRLQDKQREIDELEALHEEEVSEAKEAIRQLRLLSENTQAVAKRYALEAAKITSKSNNATGADSNVEEYKSKLKQADRKVERLEVEKKSLESELVALRKGLLVNDDNEKRSLLNKVRESEGEISYLKERNKECELKFLQCKNENNELKNLLLSAHERQKELFEAEVERDKWEQINSRKEVELLALLRKVSSGEFGVISGVPSLPPLDENNIKEYYRKQPNGKEELDVFGTLVRILTTLQNEREVLISKKKLVESNLTKKEKEVEALTEEIGKKDREHAKHKVTISQLIEENERVKKDVENLFGENTALRHMLETEKEDYRVANMSAISTAQKQRLDRLEEERKEYLNEGNSPAAIKSKEALINTLREEKSKLETKVKSLTKELENVQDQKRGKVEIEGAEKPVKVLHMKINPLSQLEAKQVESESGKSYEKMYQRLKDMWRDEKVKAREIVRLVSGYNIDIPIGANPIVSVQSVFSTNQGPNAESEVFKFQYDHSKHSLTPQTAAGATANSLSFSTLPPELQRSFNRSLMDPKYLPIFFSHLTLQMYSQSA